VLLGPISIAFMMLVATGRAAFADDLPVRKSGHWQITTIAAALGMTTIDACIDTNDSIAAVGEGRSCSRPEGKRTDDQVIVNITCTSALGEERISTLFTGDFLTWYRGIVKMTFDPPSNGMANMGVTIDAKYIGPDCTNGAP